MLCCGGLKRGQWPVLPELGRTSLELTWERGDGWLQSPVGALWAGQAQWGVDCPRGIPPWQRGEGGGQCQAAALPGVGSHPDLHTWRTLSGLWDPQSHQNFVGSKGGALKCLVLSTSQS